MSEAIAAYEHAIACDPALADAHWNLARLLELVGRRTADELVLRRAVRHLVRYRDLARAG
ncbi:MAG: tetratricopeptide repeat protein [Myxococcales bacterium]|nr:tetratricopeptide repeat protein [Myxococcales bacterium]